jgi:PKD domain
MKSFFIFFIFLVLLAPCTAQKHDNTWLFGRTGWNVGAIGDSLGITELRFDNADSVLAVNREAWFVNFKSTKGIISDSSGALVLFSNGENIYNKLGEIVENGGDLTEDTNFWGASYNQGSIILPSSAHGKYFVISYRWGFATPPSAWLIFKNLYASVVDIHANGGAGKVIQRKNTIIEDTLSNDKITAVKHANGRDWWLIAPKDNTNGYFLFYCNPDTIQRIGISYAGSSEALSLGQAVFSPDGTKYARLDDTYINMPAHLNVLGFDRCSGQFTSIGRDTLEEPCFGGGIAFSHDSRYLYLTKQDGVRQYDLTEPDFWNKEVMVAEIPPPYSSTLHFAQLGSDGRIYITQDRSVMQLPVINFPHRSASEVGYDSTGLQLLTYSDYATPNFPWFRLGPVDGSPCDTLGLDNHPLCHWRWEQERLNQPLEVTFTDLTTYEPTYWFWDFGDGSTSTDRHPFHTYDSAGVYTVCLVVGNANSSDTLCRVLPLGDVSSSEEVEAQQRRVSVTPNPFTDHLTVFTPDTERDLRFQLFSVLGSMVIDQAISGGVVRIETGELAAGAYFWRVLKGGRVIQSDLIIR